MVELLSTGMQSLLETGHWKTEELQKCKMQLNINKVVFQI